MDSVTLSINADGASNVVRPMPLPPLASPPGSVGPSCMTGISPSSASANAPPKSAAKNKRKTFFIVMQFLEFAAKVAGFSFASNTKSVTNSPQSVTNDFWNKKKEKRRKFVPLSYILFFSYLEAFVGGRSTARRSADSFSRMRLRLMRNAESSVNWRMRNALSEIPIDLLTM